MARPSVPDNSSTRDQVMGLLRFHPWTVEELAAKIGLTANGVRAQLAALQRDGLVRRQGVRHSTGPGKPPQLYAITDVAEAGFSAAYPAVLAELVGVLGEELAENQLRSAFTLAGRRLSANSTVRAEGDAAELARALLESLGAAATVHRNGKHPIVSGTACPLATAVRRCPDSCEMVRAMLADTTGVAVATQCEHGDAPRCRFSIGEAA